MKTRNVAIGIAAAMIAACSSKGPEAPAPSSTDISENASSTDTTDMNAVDVETQASPSDSDVAVQDYGGKKRPRAHGSR